MASNEQPAFPQGCYQQSQQSSNIFYENEVKKDSEIMLRDAEVQQLLQQSREGQQQERNEQQQKHSQLQQQHNYHDHQHQQPLQYDVKMEPHSPEKAPAVSSAISVDSSISETGPTEASLSDRNQLGQSERGHMCMTCFKAFRNKPQLTQHELVHNNIRKHVCSYCEKTFKQICHLNQHIRVHTGERPYKCDVEGCGRSFAQLSNLNHHKKNHEEHVKRDISRHFRCEVCERSYATKHSLNTHIQKLHSSVKALEGAISSHLQSLSSTPARKKKKKSGELDSTDQIECDTFVMECDSDEDGLPTQVKVKSSFAPKPNFMMRIGSGDRDKNRQTPKTTLPLPFASNQSQSSAMSVCYHQSQGQSDFITTYSGSVSQGQGYMLMSQQSQNLYSQIDPVSEQNHSNISECDNPQLFHDSTTTTSHSDEQCEDRLILEQLSRSEAIIAEQRQLMQVALSHRDALLNARSKSNFGQLDTHNSRTMSQMSEIQRTSPAPVSIAGQAPMYGNSPVSIQSDVPSHVAHHYPKSNHNEHIFNPAFTEQKSVSQSNYDQRQY